MNTNKPIHPERMAQTVGRFYSWQMAGYIIHIAPDGSWWGERRNGKETKIVTECDLCKKEMIEVQGWDFKQSVCINPLSHSDPRVCNENWSLPPSVSYETMTIDDFPLEWFDKIRSAWKLRKPSKCPKCGSPDDIGQLDQIDCAKDDIDYEIYGGRWYCVLCAWGEGGPPN